MVPKAFEDCAPPQKQPSPNLFDPMNPTHLQPLPDPNELRNATLAELRRLFRSPPPPVPTEALDLLFDAASQDTGGSQAVRYFLFWLAGRSDPTGYNGHGGLELRRLDSQLKEACFEVLKWWSGPTKSDQPLFTILDKLQIEFGPDDVPF